VAGVLDDGDEAVDEVRVDVRRTGQVAQRVEQRGGGVVAAVGQQLGGELELGEVLGGGECCA
jgi:hypothetical protein